MALLDSEVYRIKAELGYNVLTIGAIPFVAHTALFEQVIVPYMSSGATTTSTTSVTAASTPTPVVLTLADATGFSAGATVVIDVDDRQERVTIEKLSGASMTVLLSKAHATSYPVTVEGGESIVREYLGYLAECRSKINAASKTAGLKSAGRGAVEWYGGSGGGTVLSSLRSIQSHWRNELASVLGLANLSRRGGGSRTEVY